MKVRQRADITRSRASMVTLVFVVSLGIVGRLVPAVMAQPAAVEDGVRDALQRYSMALESLDPDAVKKVQPGIASDALARAFREMRELKVVIEEVRVLSSDATMARVRCNVTQTLTPKAGSKQTTTVTRVVRMRRETKTWVIDNFER